LDEEWLCKRRMAEGRLIEDIHYNAGGICNPRGMQRFAYEQFCTD